MTGPIRDLLKKMRAQLVPTYSYDSAEWNERLKKATSDLEDAQYQIEQIARMTKTGTSDHRTMSGILEKIRQMLFQFKTLGD